MAQQRATPVESVPLKSSRELAAMLKRLPKEERLRVEGIIIGVDLAHKEPQGNPPTSVDRPA